MRLRILLAFLLLTSVAFAAEWKKEYKVGTSPSLQVESNDASITVRASSASTISVTVTANGMEIGSNGAKVTEWQSGDRVYLKVKISDWHWPMNFGNRSVKVEISVPQNTRVQATTSDGSLSLEGTKNVAVLKTSDGSIRVSGVEGELQARTSDGSIDADGRFTGLNLQTSDGHINADVRPGSKPSGPWNIRTSDGSIQLRLPSDIAVDLDAATSDGSVKSELPVLVEGGQSKNHLHGKINGGGTTLELRTSDGSIHIGKI